MRLARKRSSDMSQAGGGSGASTVRARYCSAGGVRGLPIQPLQPRHHVEGLEVTSGPTKTQPKPEVLMLAKLRSRLTFANVRGHLTPRASGLVLAAAIVWLAALGLLSAAPPAGAQLATSPPTQAQCA